MSKVVKLPTAAAAPVINKTSRRGPKKGTIHFQTAKRKREYAALVRSREAGPEQLELILLELIQPLAAVVRAMERLQALRPQGLPVTRKVGEIGPAVAALMARQ